MNINLGIVNISLGGQAAASTPKAQATQSGQAGQTSTVQDIRNQQQDVRLQQQQVQQQIASGQISPEQGQNKINDLENKIRDLENKVADANNAANSASQNGGAPAPTVTPAGYSGASSFEPPRPPPPVDLGDLSGGGSKPGASVGAGV
jgi:TolA-binding protein